MKLYYTEMGLDSKKEMSCDYNTLVALTVKLTSDIAILINRKIYANSVETCDIAICTHSNIYTNSFVHH